MEEVKKLSKQCIVALLGGIITGAGITGTAVLITERHREKKLDKKLKQLKEDMYLGL